MHNRPSSSDLLARLATALGEEVLHLTPLHGGCIGEVYRVRLADGRDVVAKTARDASGTLDVEGFMLGYLATHTGLPVPKVLLAAPDLLLMTHLPGDSHFNTAAERHAAELLAALHAHTAPRFGFERDTFIGGLRQPNSWTLTWREFFAEHRLRYMAREAERAGRLPAATRRRVEALADKVDRYIDEPPQPALLHGDVWTTNVLADGGRITGFLDSAIYYGHPEIELAFTTLFGTFGDSFYQRYQEIHPIAPGFWELRRDIYNLYPLLVHVRLFGGGYVGSVDQILARVG
jgi:fructosamine-3-kinase